MTRPTANNVLCLFLGKEAVLSLIKYTQAVVLPSPALYFVTSVLIKRHGKQLESGSASGSDKIPSGGTLSTPAISSRLSPVCGGPGGERSS